MKLKLQEIIWEITGKCNNGCAYCGSTDLWFEDIDEDKIKKIADAIAEYPPESLNVSGGDPLLISYATHEYIVNKLTKAKCKILFNPMSLKYATSIGPQAAAQDAATKLKILLLYSHVGVSVNTKGELNQFNNYKFPFPFTVISNFNLTNFFLFDDIATSLSKYPDCCWQIQFTMYKKDDDLGLYNYPEAVAKLNQDIAKYPNLKIVVADNANPGPCSAGIATLGILSSGDVVPCLSMRSWCEPIKVEGNILMNPLKDIWVYNFKENRFEDCICCKDICQRQILKQEAPAKPQKLTPWDMPGTTKRDFIPDSQPICPQIPFPSPTPFPNPITTVYGVTTPTQVTLYGVYNNKFSMMDASTSTNNKVNWSAGYSELFNYDEDDEDEKEKKEEKT